MSDETVLIRRAPISFAYLFWVSGMRRGEHAALRPEGTTAGRGGDSEIIVDDPTVSEEQARFRKEGDTWYLYDLAATNQTQVGGESVARHALRDGDRITLGETQLVFRALQ